MSSTPESDVSILQKQLREARQQAEEAQKRTEEAHKRAEEAQKRAEEAQKRAEEAQKRAKEAQRQAEEERHNRQEAEKKTRPTTLTDYLQACHIYISKPLRVQTDKTLSTQGSITSPKDKPCPTLLKPWTEFPVQQQQLFEEVCKYIPPDAEWFGSVQYLEELGQRLCKRPLASEKDLELYHRLAVEEPATEIISELQRIEEACFRLRLGDGIIFENHANTLSDIEPEVQERLRDLGLSDTQQGYRSKPSYADQVCVYQQVDGKRVACMIYEFKPPHKLSVYNLRAGLSRADAGSLDIPADVINRPTIPTDADERFFYHSERLTATALAQTYTYMIENGLEYSMLATGEADVFLQVKENEPYTLYYHLAEPNAEAEADGSDEILLSRTAVSQNLTFTLMAAASEPRGGNWRRSVLESVYRTTIDHEEILRQIPLEDKALSPPSSVYTARIRPVIRSPIRLRSRKPQKSRNSCNSTDVTAPEDLASPSSSSDEAPDVETPIRAGPRAASGSAPSQYGKRSRVNDKNIRKREYCTQACLLGLVRGWPLDGGCPNATAHRRMASGNMHGLTQKMLTDLMYDQLRRDLDHRCEPLGKQGARGALFRLSLRSYGYTFVAKGTVLAFERELWHEGTVYRQLDKLQGGVIPVYLGQIRLADCYFLAPGVRIIRMLLMSWGGEEAHRSSFDRILDADTSSAVERLREHGVEHNDVRPPNVLWNPELQSVMLVDFERSVILSEILKRASTLQEVSPNRKRKRFGSKEAVQSGNALPNYLLQQYPHDNR
ncbi:MAG: hypothetical protein M1818_005528 [Claussenomyces sp. TS43310]|nr:MAG: hypothetical protein M1818_005528 [Claussenomyces sp. TS43310]